MGDETTTMIFRIEKDLKTAFEKAAKDQDQNVSQLLRAFIRNTVENHAKKHNQPDLFDKKENPAERPRAPNKPKKAPKSTAAGMFAKMKKGAF